VAADTDYIKARIAAYELRIAAYEAALLAFADNGAQQSYRYDSGQEVIRVERADPGVLESLIDKMLNQRQILCQRIGLASGTHNSRGSW
jgi:hypothetical protein